MFNKNPMKNRARGKNKTSKLASQGLLAGLAGALLLNEDAMAQVANGVDVLSMDGIASAVLQDDDTLLVTLDSGQAYNVPVGGFEASGSQFLVPANFLDTLPAVAAPAAATGGSNLALIGLGVAAIGGAAAALAGGGGGDDDAPAAPAAPVTPPPPPEPNEAPVITAESAVSIAENTAAVTSASATDANAADSLTFSLSGTDAALFNIDSATGDIAFAAAPDFEAPGDAGADNVFDIVVNVTDGTVTDSQEVAVTVTNINEAPVITAAAAVSVAEGQTAVQTASATDQEGDALTFSLSGADAALFAIDAATGAITFVGAPDFEAPSDAGADNVFDITVNVTDGALTDSQDVAVTVTNVNEAPVITAAATATVAEGQTAVAAASATDVDAGDTLTFSLTGADAALFAIDAAGAITFAAAPDFENPGDAGGNNVYDIVANVTDADGLTDTQAIAVTVTDVNEAPVITAAAAVSVAEGETAVQTATATDVDGDALTFSLSGADAALFAIDAATGAIAFVAAPDFEAAGDAGADNVFDITVNVTDGALTDSQDVAVTVTNMNEAPTITAAATATVAEGQTAVATATATDIDAGTDSGLIFSLSGADAGLFSIDPATGVIAFAAAPDFENPGDVGGDNVYDIVATVTDAGGLTDDQAIAVTVTDVNEAPVITAAAAVSVAEGETAVQTATATDVDGDELTFSLSGADAALFAIDAATGAITFAAAPDFEAAGDAGADNVFDITVNVTDGALTDSQDVAVTVTNINEAPVITAAAAVSAAENQTAVATASAADPDAGDTLTFSLTGADAALFAIDDAGVITFVDAPDFESPGDADMDNVFDIVANVADADGLTDTQAIAVTVTDANEAPVITAPATASVVEDTTAVATATATDVDAGDMLTFSLTGTDAALFTIDAATGVIEFASAPDFENPGDAGGNNVYDIIANVTDGGMLTDTQAIAVTVTDMIESPAPVQSTFDENTIQGSLITLFGNGSGNTTTLTGPDVGALGLFSGAAAFVLGNPPLSSVTTSSAVVGFTAAQNFENPGDANMDNVFEVTLVVTDDASGNIVRLQDVEFTIADVDEGGTAKPTAELLPADDALIDPAAIDEDTAFVPLDVFEIA